LANMTEGVRPQFEISRGENKIVTETAIRKTKRGTYNHIGLNGNEKNAYGNGGGKQQVGVLRQGEAVGKACPSHGSEGGRRQRKPCNPAKSDVSRHVGGKQRLDSRPSSKNGKGGSLHFRDRHGGSKDGRVKRLKKGLERAHRGRGVHGWGFRQSKNRSHSHMPLACSDRKLKVKEPANRGGGGCLSEAGLRRSKRRLCV